MQTSNPGIAASPVGRTAPAPFAQALAVTILAAATLAGCGESMGLQRDETALIQTNRLSYELRETVGGVETTIPYSYTNRSGAALFIVNCNGATGTLLERWIDGEWVVVWGNVIPACLSAPIVIQPGQTIERELFVFGGEPGCECGPKLSVEDPRGVYRIVLSRVVLSFDADAFPFGPAAPLELRVSNRFTLF